jgi:SNF2 family DNA or RNA helicase
MELYNYQKDAVRFALKRHLSGDNAYIATFAGGGKSAIAINIVKKLKVKRVLILAPKILLKTWSLEFDKWCVEPEHLCIMTYESVHKIPDNEKFDYIVADEAQKIKNPKAVRTKKFFALVRRLKCPVLYMSATPFNRPIDLFPIVNFELKPKIPWRTYVIKYCAGYKGRFGWVTTGASNIPQLRSRLDKFMIVQTEEESIKLPPLYEDIVVFEENKKLTKLEESITGLADIDVNKLISNPQLVLSLELIAALRKEAGLAKISHTIKFVEDIQHPYLIFVYHRAIAEEIRDGLNNLKNHNTRIVYGANSYDMNIRHINMFNEGEINGLILSLTSAIEGLTLTRAKQVIASELPWNATTLYQAKKRIHRISQEHPVLASYLTLDNSLDYRIAQLLQQKTDTLKKFGLNI